jgi:peptide/nickel transport system permease protein
MPTPRTTLALLAALHAIVLLAGFFAPYAYDTQNRAFAFAPPAHLHFFDSRHRFHFRPFVYRLVPVPDTPGAYEEDRSAIFPIRFFVHSDARWHLFGVDEPARVFLAGTDAYGRDEFSRLLYGGRLSLFAGLLATAISLILGTGLGGLAGFYGKWCDEVIMRAAEVFMTVPWLYLLLAVRACLPLHIAAGQVFLLLIAVLGLVGWARPARLIRGVVLSAKNRDYVLAAKGFGASDLYLLRRHILPQVSGVVATQALLYIPQYILAEVTLSFFGLGVSEPDPSWGNMLAALQHPFALETCWWLFAPALLLVLVLLGYYRILSRI